MNTTDRINAIIAMRLLTTSSRNQVQRYINKWYIHE